MNKFIQNKWRLLIGGVFVALVGIGLVLIQQKNKASLGLEVQISNAQSSGTVPLIVSTQNRRYFARSGVPVYLGGVNQLYNIDFGITDLPQNGEIAFTTQLNDMVKYSPTLMRLWRWPEFPRFRFSATDPWEYSNPQPWLRVETCPGSCTGDGKDKFDLNQYDPTYFSRLRNHVIAANAKGITPYVMLFEGYIFADPVGAVQSWPSHPFRSGNNINGINGDTNGDGKGLETQQLCSGACAWQTIQDNYVKHVVDTLSDLDVMYEIVNEPDPSTIPWQDRIANVIYQYEGTKSQRHPIGISATGAVSLSTLLALSPAVSWIAPGLDLAYWNNPTPADGTKVIIADTDHMNVYEGTSRTSIPAVWRFFTRGINVSLFVGDSQVPDPNDPRWGAVQRSVRDVLNYSRRLNLNTSVPRGDLTSTNFALVTPGYEYLIYKPAAQSSFTINLIAGNYSYEWFNIVSGLVSGTGAITANGGNQTFTPPFMGEAALYLKFTSVSNAQINGMPGLLRVMSSNPRWLTVDGVNGVWLTGSHTWSNLQSRNSQYLTGEFPWTDYLTQISGLGHNFIRLWGGWVNSSYGVQYPQPFLRTSGSILAPDDALMDARFAPGIYTKFDLTQRNPEYFNRLRARVIEAGNRGMYVGVMLFQAAGQSYGAAPSDWAYSPYNATMNINGVNMDPNGDSSSDMYCSTSASGGFVAVQKRYIDWVLDAVNDLPNVIYEPANEITCATQAEVNTWTEMVMTHLRTQMSARGATHLILYTDGHKNGEPMAGNIAFFNSSADIISPTRVEGPWTSSPDQMKNGRCAGGTRGELNCSVQSDCTGGGICEYMPPTGQLQFAGLPVKPTLLDNDHIQCIYEPGGLTSSCTTALGGITSGPDWIWKSTVRGHMPIYMDGWGRGTPKYTDYGNDGSNVGDQKTRIAIGHARSFVNRMNLKDTVPSTSIASTNLALVESGKRYLTYNPAGGSWTINLSGVAGIFNIEWWDVTDARVESGGTASITGGASRTIIPPISIIGPVVAFIEISTTPPPDTTAPTVSITSLTQGETVSGTKTITTNPSDNIGVTKVEFFTELGKLGETLTSPFSFAWNTLATPNGSRSLTAKAWDAALLNTTSTGVNVLVSNAQNGGAITSVLRVPSGSGVNTRYFTDDTGKAIYLTGSHTWSSLVEEPGTIDTFGYQGYLNFLKTNNHNFIRMWSWSVESQDADGTYMYPLNVPLPWLRTGPGLSADGKLKFNLAQFDQAYFDRLRLRTIAARDKGIYVSVMLFEGWCLAGQELDNRRDCWTWHPFNINNNMNGISADTNGDGKGFEFYTSMIPSAAKDIQKAYIRKVVDTVNDLDNVLYEIVNEATPKSISWQYEMINYLKSYEASKAKKHPVGMTFFYGSGNNADLFNSSADWISPRQSASEDYKSNPPVAVGTKIIIIDTDHLWGIGGDRIWVWKSFVRGLNPIYMEEMDLVTNNTVAARVSARKAMGNTLTYANKMNLVAMIPSSNSSDCSTTYCLRNPGQEYLIYQPGSGAFTVNLSAKTYNYEWFNTVTGVVSGTGSVIAVGGNQSFTPPFTGEAALYLKLVSVAVDTTPPTVSITIPANNSITSGATVTVAANAVDPSVAGQVTSGIAGVQFLLDGVNLGTEDTSSPYSVIFDTTQKTNGPYKITARARDAAGNQTTSGVVGVTVSNVIITPTPTPTPTTFTDKQLVSLGKCLGATSLVSGANVDLEDCNGLVNQRFSYTTAKELRNGNLCLDVIGAGIISKTNIIIYDCTSGSNQKWEHVGDTWKPLHVPNLTMCMDVFGNVSTSGANVQTYTCHGRANQNWLVQNQGVIVSPTPTPTSTVTPTRTPTSSPTPTTNPTPTPTGGGGGGGGGTPSPTSVPSQLNTGDRIRVIVDALSIRSIVSGTSIGLALLNTEGTILSGPISNSGYIWWRIAYGNGITGYSVEGSGSIKYIEKVSTLYSPTPFPYPTPTPCTPSPNSGITITRNLYIGVSKGEDVRTLQTHLKTLGYFPQTQSTTMNYGSITRQSVRKYQCAKLSICGGSERTNGYGVVGPKTRKTLQGGGSSTSCPTQATTPPSQNAMAWQAGKFAIGNRVKVSTPFLNVRVTPNGPVIGKVYINTLGTIKTNPVNYYGYIWYKIDYDNGKTGFSAEGLGTKEYLMGM
ncbi:MAG: Ig-like domain-containing protein [bacterium]|nr:Ig-like domain-containing protein [bacterium]